MSSIEQRIVKVVSDRLGLEPEIIHMDSVLIDDLGADSLDIVELATAFEEEFNVRICNQSVEQIKTVHDLMMLATENVPPKRVVESHLFVTNR